MREIRQEVRRLLDQGLTVEQIAEKLHEHPMDVEGYAKQVAHERLWDRIEESERRTVLMLEGTVDTATLADGLGRTRQGLKRFRSRMGPRGVCPQCGRPLVPYGRPMVAARETFGEVEWIEKCHGCNRAFLLRCEWTELAASV